MDVALGGLKVLEFSEFVAGPYCAKLLADFGAEVVKIERPLCGDVARSIGPFAGDVHDLERSLLFHYLNTNKKSITLDLGKPEGREILTRLLPLVDVLVLDKPPAAAEQLGVRYDDLKLLNPRLVVTSITPFGLTGPHADYRSYYLNVYQSGAEGYMLPGGPDWLVDLNRPPVKMARFGGEYESGLTAASATLAAVFAQHITGQGQLIDMSQQEALLQLSAVELAKYPTEGFVESRATRAYSVGGLIPCKDGYVEVMPMEQHMWVALVELMGSPDWARDARFDTPESRAEHGEELTALIQEWAMQRSKDEIFHSCQAKRISAAAVRTAEDLVSSEQEKQRQFIVDAWHPRIGQFKLPSSPMKCSETPWTLASAAPLLGSNNEEVYLGWLDIAKEELACLTRQQVI